MSAQYYNSFLRTMPLLSAALQPGGNKADINACLGQLQYYSNGAWDYELTLIVMESHDAEVHTRGKPTIAQRLALILVPDEEAVRSHVDVYLPFGTRDDVMIFVDQTLLRAGHESFFDLHRLALRKSVDINLQVRLLRDALDENPLYDRMLLDQVAASSGTHDFAGPINIKNPDRFQMARSQMVFQMEVLATQAERLAAKLEQAYKVDPDRPPDPSQFDQSDFA